MLLPDELTVVHAAAEPAMLLPDELSVSIVSYVSDRALLSARAVCRSWRDAAAVGNEPLRRRLKALATIPILAEGTYTVAIIGSYCSGKSTLWRQLSRLGEATTDGLALSRPHEIRVLRQNILHMMKCLVL